MDAFREQLNKPLAAGIIGLVIGIIIGLVVLGWWLFPVEWTDAIPEDLSGTWKAEYLRMAIEANQAAPNPAQAQMRYQALGESADETLAQVQLNPGNLSPEAVNNFRFRRRRQVCRRKARQARAWSRLCRRPQRRQKNQPVGLCALCCRSCAASSCWLRRPCS
jgi:hypothetical protein